MRIDYIVFQRNRIVRPLYTYSENTRRPFIPVYLFAFVKRDDDNEHLYSVLSVCVFKTTSIYLIFIGVQLSTVPPTYLTLKICYFFIKKNC